MLLKDLGVVMRYGLSLAAVVLATLVTLPLRPYLEGTYTPALLAAVTLSAIVGGVGPGVFASVLSAVCLKWFLIAPRGSMLVEDWNDIIRFVVFLLVSGFLIWLGASFRRAYRASESSKLQLLEEQKVRDRFVAALSHDLRTPLAAAGMCSQFIRRKAGKDLAAFAERIESNLNRANDMITDLLDANQVKAGKELLVSAEPCALDACIKDSIRDLSLIHGERFELSFKGDLKGRWDPSAIRRVVENLVSNAVKYGASNRPISVTAESQNGVVVFCVHNWGDPIPKNELNRLFDLFHRGTPQSVHKAAGWGIGLTLVKGLVEAHRGELRVRSDASCGTTFTVILPRDATSSSAPLSSSRKAAG